MFPLSSALNVPFGFFMLIWIAGRPGVRKHALPPVTYFICIATLFLLGAPLSILVGLICTGALGKSICGGQRSWRPCTGSCASPP